jgi:hypothetical protein
VYSQMWFMSSEKGPMYELMVAAARMHAHKDDPRQYFPFVETILALKELRNQDEVLNANWHQKDWSY